MSAPIASVFKNGQFATMQPSWFIHDLGDRAASIINAINKFKVLPISLILIYSILNFFYFSAEAVNNSCN